MTTSACDHCGWVGVRGPARCVTPRDRQGSRHPCGCGNRLAPRTPPDYGGKVPILIDQTGKILDGKAGDVIAGIRRRATRFGYDKKEGKGADECATYLVDKREYLDYPAFLDVGRPIASGLMEGARRWMIKDWMEMTWADGAGCSRGRTQTPRPARQRRPL